jgi:hypothetical protein
MSISDGGNRYARLVGLALALIMTAATPPADAADISYAPDLRAILVDGAITPGDLERIETVSAAATGAVEAVYLHSFGGDFMSAIEVGYWVREHHLATYASEQMCDSSCGFLWLAGERRFSNGVVSVHMPFTRTSMYTIAIPDEGIANAAWYLAAMGYDRQLLNALLVVSLTESNEVFPITGPNTAMYRIAYDHFPGEDLFKAALATNKAGAAGKDALGD